MTRPEEDSAPDRQDNARKEDDVGIVQHVAEHETGAEGTHDGTWFDQVFADHATAIYRYFVRRTDRNDVDDLVAEVFTTAWRRRDKVPDGHTLPWLYRTAAYTLANHRRKPTLTLVPDHEDSPERSRSSDPAEILVEDDELRRALDHLSSRDRAVLMLHAWEGLDGEGLAEALGISRGGAAAALSRARSRLREAWEET